MLKGKADGFSLVLDGVDIRDKRNWGSNDLVHNQGRFDPFSSGMNRDNFSFLAFPF